MGDLPGQAGRPSAKKGGKKPVSGEPAMGVPAKEPGRELAR